MKNTMIIRNFWFSSLVLLLALAVNSSAQVIRQAKSLTPANINFMTQIFRNDLGGANNGNGNSYRSGYREIDWEDLPPNMEDHHLFLQDYYNKVAPRGVLLSPAKYDVFELAYSRDNFQTFHSEFKPYSGNTIFSPVNSNYVTVSFVIPGTDVPASVSGFGIVFTDIDAFHKTFVGLYDEKGLLIETLLPESMDKGVTFIGVNYTDGRRIARVQIRTGVTRLDTNDHVDDAATDKVAIDNIIYGEPRAIEHHKSDFDGDGTTDLAIFRPSDGKWYMMNSGTNTFSVVPFGVAGDIPVDGDFDGDARSDFAVFRPSTATWWVLRSSDLQAQASQFGLPGDKPVAGDYDKDGKTDYAVWRDGMYWILQSSNGEGIGRQFGLPGDIPIGAAMQ